MFLVVSEIQSKVLFHSLFKMLDPKMVVLCIINAMCIHAFCN